jgi:SAM-dependent methyltransferase
MKFRESGMPSEDRWASFFNPTETLKRMELSSSTDLWVDIGCGYGTFIIPGSSMISGKAVGIDIDHMILEICRKRLKKQGVSNIELILNDISSERRNAGVENLYGQVDYVSLFNILHCENPHTLLNTAHFLLRVGGTLAVTHWKREQTPRGPSMEIRPEPKAIELWGRESGFSFLRTVDLPPYHYGLLFIKGAWTENR